MKELLLGALKAALRAANPLDIVPPRLPMPPLGRTLVVGGGKAAASMAAAVENAWPEHAPLSGLVVTRYQHGLPTRRIEVVEASHPLPDGQGALAARSMLDQVRTLGPQDLLLVLLSGGGSSLLALPDENVTLQELRTVTKSLLACGAPIQEINAVRKHLTRFSGGRLAHLSQAPTLALIISDVVGNDPTHIASGPTAPDPTTFGDAASILDKYAIDPPMAIAKHFKNGMAGLVKDTPKPGDPEFIRVKNIVVGSARDSLLAAEKFLTSQGIETVNMGELEGEASLVAQQHAHMIHEAMRSGKRRYALLSGGETTVTVRNSSGRGGRNTEYLLALGNSLHAGDPVQAIACDTDGMDGTEDNAGAIWTADSWKRANLLGLDMQHILGSNNAYVFFKTMGDLVMTGPTRTNVNDFRLVLIA